MMQVDPMRWLTLALALTPLVASPVAGDSICPVNTHHTLVAGEFYLRISPGSPPLPEFWEESNGAPGLQAFATYCQAGVVPPDTCITHSERSALVGCALAYPSTLP